VGFKTKLSDRDPVYRIEEFRMQDMMRISKITILIAAGLSFLLSVYLWFSGDREAGLFVGIWVPSILSFGALMHSGKSFK
jgi:cytochrome c oxidase subunit IV